MVDYPRAFEITESVPMKKHHPECSWHYGILCDCDVLLKHPEYLDRNKFYGTGGVLISESERHVVVDHEVFFGKEIEDEVSSM